MLGRTLFRPGVDGPAAPLPSPDDQLQNLLTIMRGLWETVEDIERRVEAMEDERKRPKMAALPALELEPAEVH